jgi:hypothetical protein
MLEFLRGKASDRKLRLFACACCRRAWCHYQQGTEFGDIDENIVISEGFADGQVSSEQMQEARANSGALGEVSAMASIYEALGRIVDKDAFKAAMSGADSVAEYFAMVAMKGLGLGYRSPSGREARVHAVKAESGVQASLLRDTIGPVHFRPVPLNPSWQTSNVTALATAIYDDRAFDRLPILADALEDAGCDNGDVLNHCRQPGVHVRGCWVVDLVLGKE